MLGIAGVLFLGRDSLHEPIVLGAQDVTRFAHVLVIAVVLSALMALSDRQRIVFDRRTGTVEFFSRIRRWKSLRRPIADIQRLEPRTRTETYYSSSPGGGAEAVTHCLDLVFRDGARRELNRSNDGSFIRELAERVERFRR